jgi:phosphoribosylformylglycinamidine (FGAM) synthase-like enzyme
VGARPLALVNCLNFGNPEHPEVMWQLSEAIDGMAEACTALGVPVVGGNVSLYNESAGVDIDPTPVVGMVGIIDDLVRRPPGVRLIDGASIVVLGESGATGLAGSRWADHVHGHRGGTLPALDLDGHVAVCHVVRGLVEDGLLAGVHDIADGGLGLALAEMAVRSGVGFVVGGIEGHAPLFSEAPSRVVACVAAEHVETVRARAAEAEVTAVVVGRAGGERLVVEDLIDMPVLSAVAQYRGSLPTRMTAAMEH